MNNSEMALTAELSGQSFQKLLNAVYDPIVLTSIEGKVLDANVRARSLLGYGHDAIKTLTIGSIVNGFDEDLINQVIGALQQQRHIVLLDAHCLRLDGTSFPAEIAVSDGSLTEDGQLCFSLRDISEKKKLKDYAEDAVQRTSAGVDIVEEKVRAITRLTHEMSNPLQMVLSMVEIDGDTKYKEHLHAIAETMGRLRNELHSEHEAVAEVMGGSQRIMVEGQVASTARTVLVVDDEKPLRELFQTLLTDSFDGLSVEVAGAGAKALEMFEETHHSIIILDLLMPGMNGEDVFNKILEICDRDQLEMPAILFCTGFGLPESVRKAVKADKKHGLLQKPVKRSALVDMVRKSLESYDVRHSA